MLLGRHFVFLSYPYAILTWAVISFYFLWPGPTGRDVITSSIPATETGTASIHIKNCVEESSGAGSVFWTDAISRHMDHFVRAERAVELMSRYGALNGTGRIVDLGSGMLELYKALPKNERHRYVPVDLKERIPGSGTVVCNLNRQEFPLFLHEKVSAFTFLGSFEYMLDKMTLLRLCKMHHGAHIVMQYQVAQVNISPGNFRWVAPFDGAALQEAADLVGYDVHFLKTIDGKRQEVSAASVEGAAYIYFIPKPI